MPNTEMASININRTKIQQNVVRQFPSLKKHSNIEDVIVAALELDATAPDRGRTAAELIARRANPYGISLAVRLQVLERTRVSRYRFLIVERGTKPKTTIETARALQVERTGLYDHLLHDSKAARIASEALRLPQGSSVVSIQRAIEVGTVQHQVDLYDKVFTALERNGLYDPSYDYLKMAFRTRAARYWLAKLGMKLTQ